MELTQTIRDSTVVDHAKVAAQNKRKVFVVQLRDNAYDDPGSYARTGFAKIIEEIEEAGWRLEEMSPSQTKAGDIAHLLLFRPAADEPAPAQQQEQHEATQRVDSGQQQSYPQQHYGQTGGQYQQGYPQDPYGGQQYGTGGQQYYQNPPQQQYPPQPPQYPQQQPPPPQYPGYGQPGW